MSSGDQSCYNLAAAVVLQAVRDLEGGSAAQRRQVQEDILAGGLDRWIWIVAGDEYTGNAMLAKLRERAA